MAERRCPTTEKVQEMISSVAFPVGSIFMSVVATNPASLLGYGTWSQISQGQFLVGQKATDTDFDVAEETGGEKTHTHADHPATATSQASADLDKKGTAAAVVTAQAHTHNTPILSHNSPSHLPPYYVIYIWRRNS